MLGCKREEGSHLIWTAVSRIDVSWMAVSKELDVLFQERRGLDGKKWVCVCDVIQSPLSPLAPTHCACFWHTALKELEGTVVIHGTEVKNLQQSG